MDVAKAKQFRVTVVAGDVHLCAVTYLKSRSAAGKVQATDPGFVPHIVTSAIGNKPPGDFVVKCAPHPLRILTPRNRARGALPVPWSGHPPLRVAGGAVVVGATTVVAVYDISASCQGGRAASDLFTCARARPA